MTEKTSWNLATKNRWILPWVLSALTAVTLALPTLAAPAILIDFESFPGPDGELGTDDDVPVVIPPELNGVLVVTDPFIDLGIGLSPIVLVDGSLLQGEFDGHFINGIDFDITFDQPVHLVAVESRSSYTVEMRAFDSAGIELDYFALQNPDPIQTTVHGNLLVSSETPIARVSITPVDVADLQAFAQLDNLFVDPSPCLPSDTVMCLGEDGRFQLELGWTTPAGDSGIGRVADAGTEDSGLFWFFAPENWEILVKVLDGCGFNERFWVFFAATTNVGFDLKVTDLDAEQELVYTNPIGATAGATTDTEAFATCR